MRRIQLIIIALIFSHISPAQDNSLDSLYVILMQTNDDSLKVKNMLDISRQMFGTDPSRSIVISEDAKALAEDLNFTPGIALSLKNIGIGYYVLSEYADALRYWEMAKDEYAIIGDLTGVSNMLSNMGAIYANQADHSKAISLYLESLKIAEDVKDTVRIATAHQNIGAVHSEKIETELALQSFLKALPLFEALQDPNGIGLASLNIGEIYYVQDEFDQALSYHSKAIVHLRSSSYYSAVLRGIGDVWLKKDDFDTGMAYLDSSYAVATELGDNFELIRSINALALAHEDHGDVDRALELFHESEELSKMSDDVSVPLKAAYEGLVRIYSSRQDYKNAFEYKNLLENVNDSIFNLESDKKLNRLLFNFEIDKKESEISLLVKDNELQEILVRRHKAIRNGFVIGFAVMLLFASIFFRQRNKIKKGKKLSDTLLLNILPEEVAEELKEKGSADAKQFELVTVLFTDFKDFTKVSEQLTATELVAEINIYFKQFDQILMKYQIEKIKTIGDAYMAVCGLPDPSTHSVKNCALAALEMQDFIKKRKKEQAELGKLAFGMRVGLNSGPVVAGIVGLNKFQYDIWGDTVNVAARMESSGEVDTVNISQTTYDLIKDDSDLTFESRGKLIAKGKGEMEMYFVSLARSSQAIP